MKKEYKGLEVIVVNMDAKDRVLCGSGCYPITTLKGSEGGCLCDGGMSQDEWYGQNS